MMFRFHPWVLVPTHALLVVLLSLTTGCRDDLDPDGGLSQVGDNPPVLDFCAAVERPCSDEGIRVCENGGVSTCTEVGDCLEWSLPTGCDPGSVCDSGMCVGGCPAQECTVAGATRCSPSNASVVEVCDDPDGDGCLGWTQGNICEGGLVCADGSCQSDCSDECLSGQATCSDGAVVTCDEHDGDGCLEFGGAETCASGFCAAGACVSECVNECEVIGLVVCDGDGLTTCVEGGDGCLRWGTKTLCPEGESCSAGACSAGCIDECEAGSTECGGGGVRTCSNSDSDPCTEWLLPTLCPAGTTCSAGECAIDCVNECTIMDATQCDPQGVLVETCGEFDGDPCLEWSPTEFCDVGQGETCSGGSCSIVCSDECTLNQRRCAPGLSNQVQICANGDADPCTEWVDGKDCGLDDQLCSMGECAANCTDDCAAAGAVVCVGNAQANCGNFDGDSCLDLGTAVACASWEQCGNGICSQTQPPAQLKISELLYNGPGVDTEVFIELFGPAGTSLDGFRLVAVDGGTGDTTGQLALDGVIDFDDYFVIAHPTASQALLSTADQLSDFANLENGPDSLRLVWGSIVVDAVGYGEGFSGGFAGEGNPAVGASAGQSITRDAMVTDTDDNFSDFSIAELPTPGAPGATVVTPSVLGDLLFTEFMANPASPISDAVGEWLEIHNPSSTTSYNIAGCTLFGSNGKSYQFGQDLVIAPQEFISVASSNAPGFFPDHVMNNFSLTNSGQDVTLVCGPNGTLIDDVFWTSNATSGVARSLDPDNFDAWANDPQSAWCDAVTSYALDNFGTPGEPNPSCTLYTDSEGTSNPGICNNSSGQWNNFTFTDAPAATADATMTFEWRAGFCAIGISGLSNVAFEIDVSGTWQPLGTFTFNNAFNTCNWLDDTLTIPAATINAAITSDDKIRMRFAIDTGCSTTLGACAGFGNCAKNLELSYPL